MLVVKVELWPHGDESRSKEIARTYIFNKGGSHSRGNYGVRVCRKAKSFKAPTPETWKQNKGIARTGEVLDYPRLSYNVWRLVLRALRSAFPEEK